MSSLLRTSASRLLSLRVRYLSTKRSLDMEESSETLPGEVNREGAKRRLAARLDPEVARLFDEGVEYNAHPGNRRIGVVHLPPYLELAAKRAVSKHLNQQFRNDAVRMNRRMHHMELPLEKQEIVSKQRLVTERVIGNEPNVDFTVMTEEEKEYFLAKRKKKISHLVSTVNTSWKDIEYDAYTSTLYLGARLDRNYATAMRIFHEIKTLDASFAPKSLFDFGSGVGTTMFAANETWPHTISEHFNVDISKHMNDLSVFLLKGGQDHAPMLYNGVYHREYLPLSSDIKYDLVVSAHSLMELPSRKTRIQTIESLWQKTADILVIAEKGTRHGFSVVLEARNLILEMGGYDVTKSYYNRPVGETNIQNYDPNNAPTCHILAPCPHQYSCPRMDTGGPILCNQYVTYRTFDIGQRPLGMEKETFSYIVIRKGGKRQGDHPNWPRVNQQALRRSKHVHCRMCCPDGSQKSLLLSKSIDPKHLYQCARHISWGDLMPVTVQEEERELNFWDKMKARAKEQKERERHSAQSYSSPSSSSDSESSDSETEKVK